MTRRVVVTGGAGFVGSHLCTALVERGDEVVCIDNLSTGRIENLGELIGNNAFEFLEHDVCEGVFVDGPVDAVAHLASPASPPDYLRIPLETLAVGSAGTTAALELAARCSARFVLASTSEIYGDPLVHPQTEEYWGNVNSIGPRSVYDEAKRFSEALAAAYRRCKGTDTGIVRIFNTYGPRLQPHDGRVVSNFIAQALTGEQLTIYGDGSQTRSFCYVDDLVRGLVAMIDCHESGPINLGNPTEFLISDFATLVIELTGSQSTVTFGPLPVDDPTQRCPDISRARDLLGWAPEIDIREGLRRTISWHVDRALQRLADASEIPAVQAAAVSPPSLNAELDAYPILSTSMSRESS